MTFYHRTLYNASGITHSVIGNFLGEGKEEVIVSTGRILKLLRLELGITTPSIPTLIFVDTYDIITSLSKFRREDETKDWIVFAADSGSTTILTVNAEKMEFEVVVHGKFKVPFPKTLPNLRNLAIDSEGQAAFPESNYQAKCKNKISRTLPVQHMSVDSQGRAIFIAAMEETKRFWFFHGPGNRQLEILDDHEENTLIYDIAFVDSNSKNIVVAYLATVYEELHRGMKYEIRERRKPSLVFCEVAKDKVTEIKRINCFEFANSLISVPGQRGVLVCAEDFIAFYSLDSSDIVRCSIPKRVMDPKIGVIFACSTKCDEKHFNLSGGPSSYVASAQISIYYLVQTEQGDIFKMQLVANELGVIGIMLKYFITLPVASSLCTSESGFLFVASEFGDHYVYKIADIEYRARVHPAFNSTMRLPEGESFIFLHRNLNIAPVVEIKSFSPIMHMEFKPLSSMRRRMCLAMGRASLSTLKISKVEQDVSYLSRAKMEMEKDEIPIRMWAIESTLTISKESKTLIVISFKDSTAVYSLDGTSECVIQKMKDIPFARDINTLGCATTGTDVILQVCPKAVHLITCGENKIVPEIVKNEDHIRECAINKKSLVLAFENKQIKHHKIVEDGRVMESKIPRRLINGPATCMLLSEKNESDQLLAVGISIPPLKTSSRLKNIARKDALVNEVHLFIIGPSDMKFLYMLKVESSPYSFLFINGESDNLQSLLVGCENGKLLTLAVEETTDIEGSPKHEPRTINIQDIGSKAVQLLRAPVLGEVQAGILAVSNQSWFKKTIAEDFFKLKSEISPCLCVMPTLDSIATVLEDQLRVFILEDLQPKSSVTIPLEYTPRKFTIDSNTGNIFIIETDNNSYTKESEKRKSAEIRMRLDARKQQPPQDLPPRENIPKSWTSLLRVENLTGINAKETFKFEFEQTEAAFSLCYFKQDDDEFLLVGVAKNFKLSSECCSEASIYTYRILKENTVSLLHQTKIKSVPLAMCCYNRSVLIGIGRKLALYCVSPEKLELICERKECVSSCITAIYPVDERILVSDSDFGMSYLVYVASDKAVYLLQEDVFPTEVRAACILRGNQMARATTSRDIFIVELATLQDRDMSKVYNDDEPPFTLSQEKLLGCFHVGEVVTSMQVFNTFPNEPDTVVYVTLSGSVGFLSALPWQKDAEFFNLFHETLLRLAEDFDKERTTLPIFPNCWFRSRHFKRVNVIDGDFLDEFLRLEVGMQKIVCEEMKEAEISTRLAKIRRDFMLDFQF